MCSVSGVTLFCSGGWNVPNKHKEEYLIPQRDIFIFNYKEVSRSPLDITMTKVEFENCVIMQQIKQLFFL